jgi:proteasome lid subunit RPN8/RPN11
MRFRLESDALQAIRRAAETGYPHEVCGVLVGRPGGGEVVVLEAHACANLNRERSRDRYEMDPRDHLRVQKEARIRGLDVVGYYHSHPDHPPEASETDQALSWEGALYLIQAVEAGRAGRLKGWWRAPGEARLREVDLG